MPCRMCDNPSLLPQKAFWRKWAAWSKWVQASGEGAVLILEMLENAPKTGKMAKQLSVDSFRGLRGLIGPEWRRRLTEKAQTMKLTKTSDLTRLARIVEKEQWTEWHWGVGNSYIQFEHGMPPPLWLGLRGTAVPGVPGLGGSVAGWLVAHATRILRAAMHSPHPPLGLPTPLCPLPLSVQPEPEGPVQRHRALEAHEDQAGTDVGAHSQAATPPMGQAPRVRLVPTSRRLPR